MPASLRVLLQGQFGLFFAGNGLSLVGSWMQRIACGWLVWQWTESAFWLGILAAGDLLPVVFIGPFAGVAADRWDRLVQNRVAQAVSTLLALAMAMLLYLDQLGLTLLIVMVTLQGALVAAIQPARLAMVQQMVPREDTSVAVALNSVNVNLARLLGPALAGVAILRFDVYWIFVFNAAVTLLFVWVLGRLQLAPRESGAPTGQVWQQMAEGFRHAWTSSSLRLILFTLLFGGAVVRSMIELVPAIAADIFDNTAAGISLLTGATAIGAVASGLTVGRGTAERMILSVHIWWAVGAVATLVLTQAGHPIGALMAAVVIGAATTRGLIGTQTFVQLATPDMLRGRILSLHGLIARGSPALGALCIGFAADQVGLSLAVGVSSSMFIMLSLALLPRVRKVSREASSED